MADKPDTQDTPPTPPTEEEQKKKLHGWLDEWADARAAKNPPKRTQADRGAHDVFSSLFGG